MCIRDLEEKGASEAPPPTNDIGFATDGPNWIWVKQVVSIDVSSVTHRFFITRSFVRWVFSGSWALWRLTCVLI